MPDTGGHGTLMAASKSGVSHGASRVSPGTRRLVDDLVTSCADPIANGRTYRRGRPDMNRFGRRRSRRAEGRVRDADA